MPGNVNFLAYRDADLIFHHSGSEHPDPSEFFMHTHDACELYIFLSGRGVFHIEGTEYPLESGDILIMRQSESHYIEVDPSMPYHRAALNFSPSMLAELDPQGKLLSPFYDRPAGRFNRFRDCDFPDTNHRIYVENLLKRSENKRLQILSYLIPLLWELYWVSEHRDAELRDGSDTTVSRIIRYINRNLSTPINLNTICDEFFISKPQLCRSFKQATGSSVGEYITVKRLINARELLRKGELPTQVCANCGFNDYSSFYRAYHKRFGISPQKERSLGKQSKN